MGKYITVPTARSIERGVFDISALALYRGVDITKPDKWSPYPIPFGPDYGKITIKRAVPWKNRNNK